MTRTLSPISHSGASHAQTAILLAVSHSFCASVLICVCVRGLTTMLRLMCYSCPCGSGKKYKKCCMNKDV